MKLLCVGDLHLDAGSDLGRAPGDRLAEQEQVWRRCLQIAEAEDVDAILFAGDAFDKARPTPEAMLAFERPLVENRRFEGWPVYAIPGNHDRSGVAAGTGLHVLAEAGILTLAAEPSVWRIPVGVDQDVAVCALPWAPTSRIVAAANGGDRDQINVHAAELLVDVARGLRAQAHGQPAILLTHYSISGSALPNGLPVDQLREPVLDLAALEEIGFDAIVAAHIHGPYVLGEGPAEPDTVTGRCGIYVGSPMPIDFGEAGTEHGVWVLDSERWTARFIPIDSRPLITLDADLTSDDTTGLAFLDIGYAEAVQPVADAVVKLRILASADQARRLDLAALKQATLDAGAYKLAAIEVTVAKVDRGRIEGLTEELGELEALDAWMAAAEVNGTRAAALREKTTSYLEQARS